MCERASKQEEYDDLDGDRPSCYSGVKRRLFQSVVGHPLLQILTNDIVEQERREFTRQHFESCLNGATIGTVKSAWDDWKKQVEEGDDVSPATMATLKKLNITAAEQDAFIDRLKKKYGLSFSSEFEVKIKSQLKVDQQDICHVTTFYEVARQVMDKLPNPAVSVSSVGVFGGSGAGAEAATSKDSKQHQGPKK